MFNLLSELYTERGHFREAMGVHEDIIRLIVEGDDDDDHTTDTVSSEEAFKQIQLLELAYKRMGAWDKPDSVYKDLTMRLLKMPEHAKYLKQRDCKSSDHWNTKKVESARGLFKKPETWDFAKPSDFAHDDHVLHGHLHGSLFGALSGFGHSQRPISNPPIYYQAADGHSNGLNGDSKARPNGGAPRRIASNWGQGLYANIGEPEATNGVKSIPVVDPPVD
jgi:hypothetical protein